MFLKIKLTTILLFLNVLTDLTVIDCNKENVQQGIHPIAFLDGKFTSTPIQYVSGSMHYFRVHQTDWRDRLKKLRWAGLHAVQTYIEWASHEPEPGLFDFDEGRDISNFLQIAKEEGLYVILRPGPFICAERDMGGLPYWLLRLEPKVRLRTSDPKFMTHVRNWFDVLLPILKPFMLENGGPVIMVQVENEYGNCVECDFQYLNDLAEMLKTGLGPNTALFSTDNGRTAALKCAKIPGVFATVDFGADANMTTQFEAQRLFEPKGSLINSEFYTGWLDHWGEPHVRTSTKDIAIALKNMLKIGASVNFYVFHGGTSFGYGAGSNLDGGKFRATPTSYDYDAPLNEAGDPTEKYFAIREVIKQFFPVPSGLPPAPSKKCSYGDVHLSPLATVFDVIEASGRSQLSELPLTFEELGTNSGLVAYQTILEKRLPDPAVLNLPEIHDRGYVYLDNKYVGMVSREQDLHTLPIFGFVNQTLTIIIESQGRTSVGPQLNDFKGLTVTPMINGNILKKWKMTPVISTKMWGKTLQKIKNKQFTLNEKFIKVLSGTQINSKMTFYESFLDVPEEASHPCDTYVRLDNWTKGYIWINKFLLGRYWPAMGPQLTLFVPHGILRQGLNTILVLELEGAALDPEGRLTISFVDMPEIDGPTPV